MQKLVDTNYNLENKQPIYIGKKFDKIDLALAEFLNTGLNQIERDKMQIIFLRESEGVYRFGTKRVTIKIESNN